MKKVYEPTEIHVGRKKPSFKHLPYEAWMRFLARIVDYSLFFFCVSFVLSLFKGRSFLDFSLLTNPFIYLLWTLVEAFFMSRWKTTFGKYLLKIHIRHLERKKIEYMQALNRAILVWFRGMGLGIPILNLLTMFYAYSKYTRGLKMSWDKETRVDVIIGNISIWRICIAMMIVIGMGLGYLL